MCADVRVPAGVTSGIDGPNIRHRAEVLPRDRGARTRLYPGPVLIDLHAHIIPGVDDGVRTLEEARELARRSAADGVEAIAATPHVRDDYPTSAARMEEGVAELRADFAASGIPVQVLHGGELDIGRLQALPEEELRRFTLAQSGRYLLLEFPYFGWPAPLEAAVLSLRSAGLTAVIAHPERNPDVQERPARLEEAVRLGALVQLTASSLDGRGGRAAARAAKRLIDRGLVHLLASDAHGPAVREAGLAAAAAALRDPGLARYLTSEAPDAIVRGEELPRAPRRRRRRLPPFRLLSSDA